MIAAKNKQLSRRWSKMLRTFATTKTSSNTAPKYHIQIISDLAVNVVDGYVN